MTNDLPAPIALHRAGSVEYDAALRWQHARAAAILAARAGAAGAGVDGGEALAVIEHTPVFTLGRRGRLDHVLVDPDELRARGADLVATDRGGDVTFHGSGQLVAYPILDLRLRRLGAAAYVRALEQCVIETLATFGVTGHRVTDRPGVWTLPRKPPPGSGRVTSGSSPPLSGVGQGGSAKIAAVGVRIARGVSRHGLALNVSTDLAWFDAIVPCGIADAGVTSMARELGEAPAFDAVANAFADAFARVFDVRLVDVAESPLAQRMTEGVPA